MACEWNGPDLSAFADGELSPADAERVGAHVCACDECRAALRTWASAGDALRAADADPARGRAAIVAAVRAARAGAPARPRRRRWMLAAAAALVLVAPVLFFGQALATSRQARQVVNLEGENRADAQLQMRDVEALRLDIGALLVRARALGLGVEQLRELEEQARALAEESARLRSRLAEIDSALRREGLLRETGPDGPADSSDTNRHGEHTEVGSESDRQDVR
jgi:predicted anti-sigma-YlaC factor YlaD